MADRKIEVTPKGAMSPEDIAALDFLLEQTHDLTPTPLSEAGVQKALEGIRRSKPTCFFKCRG